MSKKKNTYVISFHHLTDYNMFELCRQTPLVVAKKNGAVIEQPGWDAAVKFPNPGAYEMGVFATPLKSLMGEKIATSVIEYLDKNNGRPVVSLFPTYVHIHDGYEDDYMAHLNHASRRDLAYQIALRRQAGKQR